jgi:hypothetical protein
MSRRRMTSLSIAAAALAGASRAFAGFTGFASPNDLVVVEVNRNGTAQTEDSVSLQEMTTAGAAVGDPLNLPTASGSALTLPDTSDHDGELSLSSNGRFLALGTYRADIGTADSNGLTATAVPRVVTLVTANGTLNTTTQLAGANDYSVASMRQVTTLDGREFWTTGNNGKPYNDPLGGDYGGLRYSTIGASTSTSMNGGSGFDNRTTTIFNGQLYVDTGSDNSPDGAHTLYQAGTGLPTTTPTYSALQLAGGGDIEGNQSPNFEQLASGTTVLYESNSTAGSLDKLVETAPSTWTFEGRVSLGGIEDIASSVSGNTVNLYVTTDFGIFSLTDSGGAGAFSSNAFTTLQLLPTNGSEEFRGISFAPVQTINSAWALSSAGSLNPTSDWTNGVPWTAGDTATFGGKLATSGSVTLDNNWTIGHIVFNNSTASYTIAAGSPSGTLTLDDTGGAGTADIAVTAGGHSISAPISLAAGLAVNLSSGTGLTLSNTVSGAGSMPVTVTGPGTLMLAPGSSLPTSTNLAITAGAKVALGSNAGGFNLSSLSIDGTSALDVANNHIIIHYANGTQAAIDAAIRGYLIAGRNGGTWTGTGGINSSIAALPANNHYALGYADGADGVVVGLSSGQLEIKYTLLGDADLDGSVTGSDFTALVGNLGKSGRVWDQGDFDYDGSVTGSDFTALIGNLGKTASGADVVLPAADYAAIDAFAAANGLMADVPEPGCFSLIAISSVALLRRHRRKIRV